MLLVQFLDDGENLKAVEDGHVYIEYQKRDGLEGILAGLFTCSLDLVEAPKDVFKILKCIQSISE